jgi:flavoprotein
MKRIAWGITGSGDLIKETYDVMVDIKNKSNIEIMVFLSKEGETVMKWYHMWNDIQKDFPNFKTEGGPNSPFLAGPLQVGYYDALIIAPTTSNTVAKIVYGISDSLSQMLLHRPQKEAHPSISFQWTEKEALWKQRLRKAV